MLHLNKILLSIFGLTVIIFSKPTLLEAFYYNLGAYIQHIEPFVHIIFVSSVNYSPNMGGLAGADSNCQTLANNAGLANASNYKAFMSDANTSAKDRVRWSGSIKNTNGNLVATSATALCSSGASIAVGYDENGIAKTANVFTGSNIDCTLSTRHCTSWTSNAGGGVRNEYGASGSTGSEWVKINQDQCNTGNKPIYCILDNI